MRVSEVVDEVREVARGTARVWGWAYQTLQGHLERGQMNYEVWKWFETGEVQYRIHAVSEVAKIRNPILYLGFRLVGRREQVQFARRCARRMEQLVAFSLVRGKEAEPAPSRTDRVVASPSPNRA